MPENDTARPVGLFDVDNTLLNMKQGPNTELMNKALLDAYRELGIRDIYCFTNMTFKTMDDEHAHLAGPGRDRQIPQTRAEVVEYLKKEGFRVHAVVTPADIGYTSEKGQTLGAAYDEVYVPQAQRFTSGQITSESCYEDSQFMQDRKKFSDATDKGKSQLEDFYESKGVAKGDGGFQQALNIKGLLFDFFHKHKPSWAGRALYGDDEESCVKSVEDTAEPGSVTTLLIDEPDKSFSTSDYQQLKESYKQKILASLSEEEKVALKETKKEWDIENFQKYVGELRESFPSQWQPYISTSEKPAQLLTGDSSSPKAIAMKEFASELAKCHKEISEGTLSFEDAKARVQSKVESKRISEIKENVDAPKKRVALVDIDGCMAQDGKLNEDLVQKLKDGNYDEVVLFTQRSKFVQAENLSKGQMGLTQIMTTKEVVGQLSERLDKPVKVSTSVDDKLGEPFKYFEEVGAFEELYLNHLKLKAQLAEHDSVIQAIKRLKGEVDALSKDKAQASEQHIQNINAESPEFYTEHSDEEVRLDEEIRARQQKIAAQESQLLSADQLKEIDESQQKIDRAKKEEAQRVIGSVEGLSEDEIAKRYPQGKVTQYQQVQEQFGPDTEFDFYDDSFANLNEILEDQEVISKPNCFLVSAHSITPRHALESKLENFFKDVEKLEKQYEQVIKFGSDHPDLVNQTMVDDARKQLKTLGSFKDQVNQKEKDKTTGNEKERDIGKRLKDVERIENGGPYNKIKENLSAKIDEIRNCLHYDHANIGNTSRTHKHEVTASNFKGANNTQEVFKERYNGMRGDMLKTKILMEFKAGINGCQDEKAIQDYVEKFKQSDNFKILDTGQGAFTRGAHKLGLSSIVKTDSVKAMDNIIEEANDRVNTTPSKSC